MLTVDDHGVIRRGHRDGVSIRAIARTFHHSRRKVREAPAGPEPEPYTRTREPEAPKLGRFSGTVRHLPRRDGAGVVGHRDVRLPPDGAHFGLVADPAFRAGLERVAVDQDVMDDPIEVILYVVG